MNNDLTVDDALKLKCQLEEDIYNLIEGFSEKTGLTVTSVGVEATKSITVGGSKDTLYFVVVEVFL